MTNIYTDQNTVVVNVSDFVKHDGYFHRVGTLFRMLHHHRQALSTDHLRFDFPDGEPISFTALDRVLEMTEWFVRWWIIILVSSLTGAV